MGAHEDEKLVRLVVLEGEPLARLAEQRLRQEDVPCMVRSMGVGPGGWGVAANLPFALWVRASDEMRARKVLQTLPAEVFESSLEGTRTRSSGLRALLVVVVVAALAVLLALVDLVFGRIFP